jgi:hypothetical protein
MRFQQLANVGVSGINRFVGFVGFLGDFGLDRGLTIEFSAVTLELRQGR